MKKKKLKGIKTVIWDCDGTIWEHVEYEAQIVTDVLQIPLTKEFEEQYFETIKNFMSFFRKRKMTQENVERVVQKHMPILEKYGISTKEFVDRWIKIETSVLINGAYETIKYLNESGIRNIVLSDMLQEKQELLLENYGLKEFMQKIYTSQDYYIKARKVATARIVTKGREKEYIIIGDSCESDIAFASNAGIRSIWFNPNGKENKTKYKPTREIKKLEEVIQIIL